MLRTFVALSLRVLHECDAGRVPFLQSVRRRLLKAEHRKSDYTSHVGTVVGGIGRGIWPR